MEPREIVELTRRDFLVSAAERGLHVTGIEYSGHSAQLAQERLGDRGHVIVGEIGALKDTDQTFDYVVFADVLEHVRDPRAFLSSVRGLLDRNGIVAAIVPPLGDVPNE